MVRTRQVYLFLVVTINLFHFSYCVQGRQNDSDPLHNQANEQLEKKNYDDAIGIALFGLKAAENKQDQSMVLQFLGILAQSNKAKKDYKNAIRYYIQYINSAELNNYQSEYALGLSSLGSIYDEMGAIVKGAYYKEQALNVYRKERKIQQMATLAESLSETYGLIGNKEKELESYEIMQNIGYQLGNKNFTLKAVEKLSTLYLVNGNIKSAQEDYKKLLSFQLTTDEKSLVNYKLSEVSLLLGDKRRSLYYAKQATKFLPGNIGANIQEGIAMMANRQTNEAIKQFNRTIDLAKDSKNYIGEVEGHNFLGQIYIAIKDYRTAQNQLNAAQKIGESRKLWAQLEQTYSLYLLLSKERELKSQIKEYEQKLVALKPKLIVDNTLSNEEKKKLKKAEELAESLEQEILVEVAEKERKRLALEQSRLLRATENQKLNLLKQEKEIQKQQMEKDKLEAEKTAQNLLISKQELEAEYRKAELEKLEKESELRELTEMENKRRLELAENEKLLLDQQTKLQAADIESAEQAKRYLFIIVGIAFLALVLLGYLLLRISKTKRLIALQNDDLEKQQTQLKASQERLQNTLEEQVRARNNLEKLNLQLKNTQSQLIHAEKMSSLGQLTAGIAHEVNNPIGFVKGGVQSLKITIDDMTVFLDRLSNLNPASENIIEELISIQNDYIEEKEEIHEICDQLIKDILFGASRIEEIVNGLRVFSRHEEAEKKFSDLHENLDSALLILRSKIKNKAEVIKNYDSSIGNIECYPGQLNQVFVNLVGNAVDAMGEGGKVTVTTSQNENNVRISIKDIGKGIPPEIKGKIFEPFFTTKDVGEGTGLGLSISYSIVEEHGGQISVESEVGKGTEFIIILQKIMKHKSFDQEEDITLKQ